jgi:hypothetical protein
MRPMILFIHGFGSCGWGEKSLKLRRHFGVDQVIAPDLPLHPAQAIDHLQGLVERYPVRALVGSSLGGFYATGLNALRPLPTVLINPVVRPHELLADHLGQQHRWCDDLAFQLAADDLHTLAGLQRHSLAPGEHYLVLLQQGDELLDYRQAAAFYARMDVWEIPGGSHRFEHLQRYLPQIADWLGEHTGTRHRRDRVQRRRDAGNTSM